MEERVRPCLQCETILPFDAEVCSLCGAPARPAVPGEEAVKPCLACEELIPADDIFCPACGDFALRVAVEPGERPIAPIGAREGGALTVLSRALAAGIALLALALVVAAAVDFVRLRALADV